MQAIILANCTAKDVAAMVAALEARRNPASSDEDIKNIAQAISDRKLEVLKLFETRLTASDPRPDPPDA